MTQVSERAHCSKLTIERLEQGVKYLPSQQQRHQNDARRRSGVFIVELEHISHIVLSFSIVNFLSNLTL